MERIAGNIHDYKNDRLSEKADFIPDLAKWKILITSLGVDFSEPYQFNNYKDIENYKTKKRIAKPVAEDGKVFDLSRDFSLIPSEILISNCYSSSILKLRYQENSPFIIKVDNSGNLKLFNKPDNSSIPIDLKLVEKRKYLDVLLPYKINNRYPKIEEFINILGMDRLTVLTFDGCWNWINNNSCKFCDLHPRGKSFVSATPSLNSLIDFKNDHLQWWDKQKKEYLDGLKYSFKYVLENESLKPHKHLLIMAGAFSDRNSLWNNSLDVINSLNEIYDISHLDNYLNVSPHSDLSMLEKVKKSGIKQVQYNLEVIGENNFKKMCPGKGEYKEFLNKLIEAVDVMGFGNVRSNFVLGLQPIDELLDGINTLAKKGIVADYSIFQPKRGTALEHLNSPDYKTIISFNQQLVSIYRKYGYKGIYCSLSSRSSVINEFLCTENTKDN